MPSDTDIQQLILTELGVEADSTAQTNITTWWGMCDGKESQYIQYLYAKKRVIAYLLGKARKSIDLTLGTDQFKHNQEFKNLLELMKATSDEIVANETGSGVAYLVSASAINESAGVLDPESFEFWEGNWSSFYRECFGPLPKYPRII